MYGRLKGFVMARAHNVPALDAPDLDSALAALRGHGLRVSAARRLLLESLYHTDDPLTAERLAGGLDGQVPRSDLASVYRNLETLEQVGLVKHFHLGHGSGLYMRAGAAVREYLICDSCATVRALAPAELDRVRDTVREDTGWESRFTHFPISGLCPGCRSGGGEGSGTDAESFEGHPRRLEEVAP